METSSMSPRPISQRYKPLDLFKIVAPLGMFWHATMEMSYKRIVEVFGQPTIIGSDDDKTDARWMLITPYGTVAIYNYKNGRSFNGPTGTPTSDITHWQIRGDNETVVVLIHWVLKH